MWEDALYVIGEIGNEVEWLLDTGCSLSLILVDLYFTISEAVRPKLQMNDTEITTADGT